MSNFKERMRAYLEKSGINRTRTYLPFTAIVGAYWFVMRFVDSHTYRIPFHPWLHVGLALGITVGVALGFRISFPWLIKRNEKRSRTTTC